MDHDQPLWQPDHQAPLPLGERLGDAQVNPDDVDYYLKDLGPRLVQSLFRKFAGAVRVDELPGVMDLAAARMFREEGLDKLPQAALASVFYAYCLHLTQEFVTSGWCQQRRRERSVASEKLDQLVGAVEVPLRDDGDEPYDHPARQVQLVRAALEALSERDRTILNSDATHPNGKVPGRELAAMLGVTAKSALSARSRAKERFKKAYLRLAAGEADERDGKPKAARGGQ